jgi:hypothetical protein
MSPRQVGPSYITCPPVRKGERQGSGKVLKRQCAELAAAFRAGFLIS